MASLQKLSAGFTIIELVVVMVVAGILSSFAMQFITLPIEAYSDQSKRTRLSQAATLILDKLSYDIRGALPNSIRVGCSGACIEYLNVVTGGRYRANAPGDVLSFNAADNDTSFDVLGPFDNINQLATGNGNTDCLTNTAACVAIYNTGQANSDAWDNDNIATLVTVSASSISFNNSNFSSGLTAFPSASPSQRFFIVDTPMSYICDVASGELRRYQNYNIQPDHSSVDTHTELLAQSNPAEMALLSDQVSTCEFSYNTGASSRNGVVTLSVTLTDGDQTVRLLQQVQVLNIP